MQKKKQGKKQEPNGVRLSAIIISLKSKRLLSDQEDVRPCRRRAKRVRLNQDSRGAQERKVKKTGK